MTLASPSETYFGLCGPKYWSHQKTQNTKLVPCNIRKLFVITCFALKMIFFKKNEKNLISANFRTLPPYFSMLQVKFHQNFLKKFFSLPRRYIEGIEGGPRRFREKKFPSPTSNINSLFLHFQEIGPHTQTHPREQLC